MNLWQITYTNIITGERQTYMDVGFESPKSAKEEIRRLRRDAKKLRKDNHDVNSMFMADIRIPTALIGKYWRVKHQDLEQFLSIKTST